MVFTESTLAFLQAVWRSGKQTYAYSMTTRIITWPHVSTCSSENSTLEFNVNDFSTWTYYYNKHQYLYTKSCHPKHCNTAIPYSQALRIKRICLEQENLLLWTNQLKHHLSKRGYSDQFLDSEINREINTSHGSSSLRSNRQNSNRVPLVVMYHPNLPKLEQIIRCSHHILQDLDGLQKAFPFLTIIAFWRLRNLRDILVRANITPETSDHSGNFRCEACRCKNFPILVTTNTFSSSVTQNVFN